MSWDDDNFEVPALAAADDEEEQFVAMARAKEEEDINHADGDAPGIPVLVVDLAPMAAAEAELAGEYSAVRSLVVNALHHDWTGKSSDLMLNHLAWHLPKLQSAALREAYEAAHPGSMLSVIEYPLEVDGVRTATLWRVVTRPTPWEVLDAIKAHLSLARRPLKFMADFALELEELAEAEAAKAEEIAEGGGGSAAAEEMELEMADEMDVDAPSLLDCVLDVIFERYDANPLDDPLDDSSSSTPAAAASSSWTERAIAITQRKKELKRMWRSTFGGRLPAASSRVLKHAPRAVSSAARGDNQAVPARGVRSGRPKMLVPPPVVLP